jgi:hypothetical protein
MRKAHVCGTHFHHLVEPAVLVRTALLLLIIPAVRLTMKRRICSDSPLPSHQWSKSIAFSPCPALVGRGLFFYH